MRGNTPADRRADGKEQSCLCHTPRKLLRSWDALRRPKALHRLDLCELGGIHGTAAVRFESLFRRKTADRAR
jgi:hypothetical protein